MTINARGPLVVRQGTHAREQTFVMTTYEPNMALALYPVNTPRSLGLRCLGGFCGVNFRIAKPQRFTGKGERAQ